jgi:cytochrome oxidase assembly protein ShyY1
VWKRDLIDYRVSRLSDEPLPLAAVLAGGGATATQAEVDARALIKQQSAASAGQPIVGIAAVAGSTHAERERWMSELDYRRCVVSGVFDYSKEVYVGPKTAPAHARERLKTGSGYAVLTPLVIDAVDGDELDVAADDAARRGVWMNRGRYWTG